MSTAPVPPWAEEQIPIVVDLAQLPRYFHPVAAQPQKPTTLEHRGRWNSITRQSFNANPPSGAMPVGATSNWWNSGAGVDPGLLDSYDLNGKWHNLFEEKQAPTGRFAWLHQWMNREYRMKYIESLLSSNPFIPFLLRGSALIYSVIALGIACRVYVDLRRIEVPMVGHPESPAIVAICICTISACYLAFSIVDEFFGQPLGLRTELSKMKFVVADLVLIGVMTANLATSLDAIVNRPYICPGVPGVSQNGVCSLQRTTVAFIFMSLILWIITSLLSNYRMMARASH